MAPIVYAASGSADMDRRASRHPPARRATAFAACLFAAGMALGVVPGLAQEREKAPEMKCEPPLKDIQCERPLSTDPRDCEHLWRAVGLPRWHGDTPGGGGDEAEEPFTTVCHHGYVARNNNAARTPDWVLQRLDRETSADLNRRPDADFVTDPCIGATATAVHRDYRLSNFAKGHQAASNDFAGEQPLMCDTFFYSNAVPQVGPNFNSSDWRELEERVQTIARTRDEIYVFTGPIYQSGGEEIVISDSRNSCGNEIVLPALDRAAICGGMRNSSDEIEPTLQCGGDGVAIPAGLFKIVFDARNNRVNAYIMPNVPHPVEGREDLSTDAYIDSWRVSVLMVEDLTEYEFLTGLDVNRLSRNRDTRSRRRAKARCPATMHR